MNQVNFMNKLFFNRELLETRFRQLKGLNKLPSLPGGWIKAVRMALGINLRQLGKKLNISKQSAADIERREADGTITINALKETAAALDMDFVYALLPKDGSLEKLIEKKAIALAEQIVSRASVTMKLEAQENSELRNKKTVTELTERIKLELPKALWE